MFSLFIWTAELLSLFLIEIRSNLDTVATCSLIMTLSSSAS